MCVINVAEKADTGSTFPGQSAIVPWLVCMDSDGDPTAKCNQQVGVSSTAVEDCMSSEAPALLAEYIKKDAPIQSTPTVAINGKHLKSLSFTAIKQALCAADSSLKGCSAPVPNGFDPDWETTSRSVVPQAPVVV